MRVHINNSVQRWTLRLTTTTTTQIRLSLATLCSIISAFLSDNSVVGPDPFSLCEGCGLRDYSPRCGLVGSGPCETSILIVASDTLSKTTCMYNYSSFIYSYGTTTENIPYLFAQPCSFFALFLSSYELATPRRSKGSLA